MNKNSEDKENSIEENIFDKNNQSFLSNEAQSNLKDLIPPSTLEEIMSCDAPKAKSAEKMVLYFGKCLGNFENQEDLNIAMRILQIASILNAKQIELSKYSIFQSFCETYGEFKWDNFEKIIKRLMGNFSNAPLQRIKNNLKFTTLGRIVIHNYQKIKSEMLGMEEYGLLHDLFAAIEDIRSYWNYNQYGLEIDFIFSLSNNLKNLIDSLMEKGETIVKDPRVDIKINAVFDLIDQILNYQKSEELSEDLKIQQIAHIINQIIIAIKQILYISGRKFNIRTKIIHENLINAPFEEMENFVLENFEKKKWKSLFFNSLSSAVPAQYPMKINSFLIKRALINFLRKKDEISYTELPEAPTDEIEETPTNKLFLRESNIITIEEKLFDIAKQSDSGLDYHLIKNKKPLKVLERLIAFHNLAFKKKIHLDEKIQIIKDYENFIELFDARMFKMNLKKDTSKPIKSSKKI